MNATHVLELKQPVRGERFVLTVGRAEPLEALPRFLSESGTRTKRAGRNPYRATFARFAASGFVWFV